MKKVFIYYSHTGNGELVAKEFEKSGYEIRRVYEKARMPKSFFWQMMVGGFRAGFGKVGKLIDYDNNVEEYGEIVIGSPIWNGKMPPATNAVLKNTDLKDKNVKFVFYSGSGEGKGAVKKLNKLFDNPHILFLQEPKKYKENLETLKDIIK